MKVTSGAVEQVENNLLDQSKPVRAEVGAKIDLLKQRYQDALQDNPPRQRKATTNAAKLRRTGPSPKPRQPDSERDTAALHTPAPGNPEAQVSARTAGEITDRVAAGPSEPRPKIVGEAEGRAAEDRPNTAGAVTLTTSEPKPKAVVQAEGEATERQPDLADMVIAAVPAELQTEAAAQAKETAAERRPDAVGANTAPRLSESRAEVAAQVEEASAEHQRMALDNGTQPHMAMKQRYTGALLSNPRRVRKPQVRTG